MPSENLTVEYKSWLDLSNGNVGKAILAKAAIALANEGGGIIVLGMREGGTDGALASQARPEAIPRYNQDDINAAIYRFCDPQFHSELIFAVHPETTHEHAFVVVPGGHHVPVMSVRGCEDNTIHSQRCYIRKPGPRSEEPHTTEEWRNLLERCVRARREDMLDAIRMIVMGHHPIPATVETATEALTLFMEQAKARWLHLAADLPADSPARMPHGHYEVGFSFSDVPVAANLNQLRERLSESSRTRYTGWGPFVSLTRPEFTPRPVDGNIEAWLGVPGVERLNIDAAHCDFWRANPSGLFFLMRGYEEDGIQDRFPPATICDITMPIWRIGEIMLYAARMARQYSEDNIEINFIVRYSGLAGRRLDSVERGRHFSLHYTCADNEAELRTTARTNEIEDNLVEVLHSLLSPLYERFSFFPLSQQIVQTEMARMRRL